MPITDYNKKKKLEVSSTNDSGTTQDKAQPVLIEGESDFNVSNSSFKNDSFDPSSQVSTNDITDAVFADSGTKLYITDRQNIFEYDLSSAFEVATASFNTSFKVTQGSQTPDIESVTLSDTGDKLYVSDTGQSTSFSRINEYDLTTNFDLSTISFNSSSNLTEFGHGLAIDDTGSRLYISDSFNDKIFQYELSTPFSISSASQVGSFDVSSESSGPFGVTIVDDGGKIYLAENTGTTIFQYDLSTDYDITTASFNNQSFDVSSETSDVEDVFFDSGKMLVTGSTNNNVYRYNITPSQSESTTGTGDVVIDFTNINSTNPEEDIAVYDQNGNLLDYEIESLDTSAETGVIWAYDSWVRDDTVQAQVAYGNNTGGTNNNGVDRQNVTGTWGNTGQNAVLVQHLNGNATDSTSNNFDGTINDASNTQGQLDGGLSFDGVDDGVDLRSNSLPKLDTGFTVTSFSNHNSVNDGDSDTDLIFNDNNTIRLRDSGSGTYKFFIKDLNNGFKSVSTSISNSTNFVFHGTYDGSTGELFKDAGSQGTLSAPDYDPENKSASIGQFAGGANPEFLDGTISDVRLFSEKKSNSWIQADFDEILIQRSMLSTKLQYRRPMPRQLTRLRP